MRKRTKIIATLGPASSSPKIISDLIKEGTDVFRVNLSHANISDIENILKILKAASLELKRPVATPIDLQRQKIRLKITKSILGSKHMEKNLKQIKKTYTKWRFRDVGMEFQDVGCVGIPFAINSNQFSAHSH